MFDLSLTQTLSELFAVERRARDAAWTERFMTAAWNGSVVVNHPPEVQGPDGFPYLRLNLPEPRTPFDSNAMANLAATCVARGSGIAFFASAADPVTASQFVLSTGMIGSLLHYDSWHGDPQDVREADAGATPGLHTVTLETSHKVMLGTPSADFLSPATAQALARHMRHAWGIADPRVQLLLDQQLRPTRNLVLGRKRGAFESDAAADRECRRIMWYLPPARGLMLMPDGWDIAGMARLEDLGRAAAVP